MLIQNAPLWDIWRSCLQSVDHVDLPPSPRNHEIVGVESYILYYPYYFLKVRGTDRKTQSPFPQVVGNWLVHIE